ncbi:MAG: carbohydrate binding family 9 domain-containing protein [Candidatus Aminicenantes bacterium]|nr:carbohydrate binding family 9 domain-containing protein [Candidatus Aminicenantes bacterium]
MKKKGKSAIFFMVIGACFFLQPVRVQGEGSGSSSSLRPPKLSDAPCIDGIIDDAAWDNVSPVDKNFVTYNPTYGDPFPHKTLIWMAYDGENLYFAFHCFDNEPGKIKTSVTRRDSIFADDWVGLSLDSQGNKQTSYDFFVNPSGIQGDILTSAVSGEDLAPDFVWESAGRMTEDGYQVEIRIPLKTIRFKSGDDVRMGILFWRRISRLGMSGSWPKIEPGEGIFNVHSVMAFDNLKAPLNLEILPSMTMGGNSQRETQNKWGKADTFIEPGISLKYGLTSSLTADFTLNPDFSQVESDSYQVEVNRRYPIFFSEKRPFFMEGADIFSFFTMPYGYFERPVHTRRIIDPLWGAKLTGAVGKTAVGVLAAGDESPGAPWENEANPFEGKRATFSIARGKYSLGGDNYFGALYSGREFAGGYNRVAGTDIGLRFLNNHQIFGSFMQSLSRDPELKESSHGSDVNLMYSYQTRSLGISGAFEHIDRDFDIESGFLRRTGITEGWIWIGPNFFTNPEKTSWLRRISPHFTYQHLHDHTTGLDDNFYRLSSEFYFTRQGVFSINLIKQKEGWAGKTFHQKSIDAGGGIQLFKWLRLSGGFWLGNQIYYSEEDPYLGNGRLGEFSFIIQPGGNLRLFCYVMHNDFSRDKERIYIVNIINSQVTYQFNKYFFIRAIVQYDSYEKKMLTDFLASFTLIPGTVLHVGYGGIYDRREWTGGEWQPGRGNMQNVKRSFFFKASYLWRF